MGDEVWRLVGIGEAEEDDKELYLGLERRGETTGVRGTERTVEGGDSSNGEKATVLFFVGSSLSLFLVPPFSFRLLGGRKG